MIHVVLGLGNPGEEYKETRHNTGRMVLEYFAKENDFSLWEKGKKIKALEAYGKIGKEKVIAVIPETFMNKSGEVLSNYIKSKKDAERLIVIYDDLDIPMGSFKISFGRSSGGHRGVESVIKKLGTRDFVRIRVGISPATPSGKLKKPSGEKAVEVHILGKFKKPELELLKKESKGVQKAIERIITEGRYIAMGEFN